VASPPEEGADLPGLSHRRLCPTFLNHSPPRSIFSSRNPKDPHRSSKSLFAAENNPPNGRWHRHFRCTMCAYRSENLSLGGAYPPTQPHPRGLITSSARYGPPNLPTILQVRTLMGFHPSELPCLRAEPHPVSRAIAFTLFIAPSTSGDSDDTPQPQGFAPR
jgi:hypothetical protein